MFPRFRAIVLAFTLLATCAQLSRAQEPEWIRPQGIDGTLVLCGGIVPEAALKRFLQAAGGDKAKLVVVAEDTSEPLRKKWTDLKVESVVVLATQDTEALMEALGTATGIWLEDGEAPKMAKAFADKTELQKLLARNGVVGSSGETARLIAASFLPGGLIETHFRDEKRAEQLKNTLAKRGGLVGYGIDDKAALIVHGRNIEVVGEGGVKVLLAAGKDRPAQTLALKAGGKQDLTALRRNATARAVDAFPPKEPRAPEVPSGTLVIVGGGGNPQGLTEKFIEFAGGPDALIVVLPTAGDPEIAPNGGTAMFTKAGAKNVVAMPSRWKKDVEDPKNLEILSKARGVWFGGGRQWHFVDAYEGTKALPLFHEVLKRGGVIGGSSAGATIQGEYLSRGGVFNNFDIIYEGYERGFGFLLGVAIDQHFTQRKRHPDMTKLMKAYPQLLGIGLDESTALIVRGHLADVSGKGTAHFYDTRTPPQGAVDYTPVRDGGRYDLKERRVVP